VRVVNSSNGKLQTVGKYSFANYGSHCENYPNLPYFTAAASIGQTKEEIDLFLKKLRSAYEHFASQEPVAIFKNNAQLVAEHSL